ncbi:uncharacterized protein LOC126903656 isoform X1 [Daktulosphaira vitifoliae]|uniref:uncharacterized protein LOC126903656 isoform X1 n=1 Tax=Daktulosphaira vitifoliae TaxID=58002 RepID=UPI0021A99ED7|nr:uncharacterized protein LOC126903656 isoform X1 [Daktulosphaira vitifoliae]XP_050537970.1 uncharacterized protein LOC126903656 isoform X1 [Daktulosphaira vitifoliae]XP_050537971.1 uncharacterized protein LOC126903656 isoform X1 [Daktulosphaira vitifoliae]
MNSLIEKENSSKCMVVVMSKFAKYKLRVRRRDPLEDDDPNSQDSGSPTAHSDDSRSMSTLSESNTSYTADSDDEFLDIAVSPTESSPDSLLLGFSTLTEGHIISQSSIIVKRKTTKYSSDTPRKTDLLFGDNKNNEAVARKRKLTRDLESNPEINVLIKKTRPSTKSKPAERS